MSIEQILVVDDEPLMRKFLAETLRRQELDVVDVKNGEEALLQLEKKNFDVVFTDIKMPGISGMEILTDVKEKHPGTFVVMMTAYGTVESAVEAMKMGAEDYMLKPFMPDQVETVLDKLRNKQNLLSENRYLRSELDQRCGFGEIVGDSPAMREIFTLISKVAKSRATVLIQGESGTGKELIARAIHYNSSRSDNPFIKINCAALPEGLLESELFGHEKGAFTGAVEKRQGRFELANSGTLLLDEISEISSALQAKLLRALQEREFERVGGMKSIKVDVRLISTTNRKLLDEVNNGAFREDLFYRLNVVPIYLPPLRERKQDVQLLAKHFLKKYCKENGRPQMDISKESVKRMMDYNWPGNIRELENLIERAVVIGDGESIQPEHLSLGMTQTPRRNAGNAGVSVGHSLKEMERDLILETLKSQGGNRTRTAEMLQISIRTLRNKLHEYNAATADDDMPEFSGSNVDKKPADIAPASC